MNQTVDVRIGAATMLSAYKLSERFNFVAATNDKRIVAGAALSAAIEFLEPLAQQIAKNGWTLCAGSAWHWDDHVLSARNAAEVAGRNMRDDMLMGESDVNIPFDNFKKMVNIRKAFNLSGHKDTARLLMSVYETVLDGKWRGNTFYLMKNDKRIDLDGRAM